MQDKSIDLRRNNFDLIRLVLAAAVFVGHAVGFFIPALKDHAWFWAPQRLGEVAVECFFVVSGFLIFMSWERTRSTVDFAVKRAARILPAYIAVVVFCALGGALMTSHSWTSEFGSICGRYLAANLCFLNFLQPTIPGAYEAPGTTLVNGSLWTIKIEVMFYLAVPILALLLARSKHVFFWLINGYLLSILYKYGLEHYARETGRGVLDTLARQLPGQLSLFLTGFAIYRYLPVFLRFRHLLLGVSVLVLALQPHYPFLLLRPAALGVITIYCAYGLPYLGNLSKWTGDLSYGIYIFHFPILHIVVSLPWLNESPWAAMIVSTIAVFAAAAYSWRHLERPWLEWARGAHWKLWPFAAWFHPTRQVAEG